MISSTHAAFAALGTALLLSASASAQTMPAVQSTLIADGLVRPIWVGSPPADTHRLFIIEYKKIRIVEDGILLDEPFLDADDPHAVGGERDLWSLAFHPDFEKNRRLFLLYEDTNGDSVLAEYTIDANDPNRIDYSSHRILFGPVFQPDPIHPMSDIRFSPIDGKLYLAAGDGGPVYDPRNRAQDLTLVYGKILRFDIDLPHPHIPSDNPWFGDPAGHDTVWSYGLRTSWRIAFDSLTGDLYISDVGQDRLEEINIEPPNTPGRNYGWRCLEGTFCTTLGGCSCTDPRMIPPARQFGHVGGKCAVIGGEVYRGTRMPWLYGRYFYADFCSDQIWSFRWENDQVTDLTDHTNALDSRDDLVDAVSTFGRDAGGELYYTELLGRLYRIDPPGSRPISFCSGDGGDATPCADCPCGNEAAVGADGGCLNAEGRSGLLVARGNASVSTDTIRFEMSGGGSNSFAVLFSGDSVLPRTGPCAPGTGIASSTLDGLRCVGTNLYRHGARATDATGSVGFTNAGWGPPDGPSGGIIAQGSFVRGRTRNFQVIYRDAMTTGCRTGQNTTNAVSRTMAP